QYTDFYIKDTVTGVIYGTTTTLTQTAIEDFATVTLYANSSDTTGTELDYGDDYTVTFSYDASGNATAFTLQFTSDGIDKLSTAAIAAANNGDDTSYMTITYNGTVIAAGTTSNSAQIFYNYGEGEIEEDPKDPESETFDIELIKLFSGTGTPDATEVEFVLSTDADGTNVIYTTKSSDGVYVVDTSLVSGSTMSPVSDGTLKIQGLADGTYYITEVQTAEGYSLLDDPVLVTINGATITLTITNEKDSIFNLPVTGGLGAIGYTAIGIGFICLAVFMVTKLCGAKKVK
ncbi:MAG: hypothetical protein LUH47_07310, partial [Clostridiales bacterium]|nr:hypothetical protein [Clostridiales bacterium]